MVEDGPPQVARRSSSVSPTRLVVRYVATGTKVGRARAGNLALVEARGEWLNFLDDDDVLFADHVEILVDAVERHGRQGRLRARLGNADAGAPIARARSSTRLAHSRATGSRSIG